MQYLNANSINDYSTPVPCDPGIVAMYSRLKRASFGLSPFKLVLTQQHPTDELLAVIKKKASDSNCLEAISPFMCLDTSAALYGLSKSKGSSLWNCGSSVSYTLTWFRISTTLCGSTLVSPSHVHISCKLGTRTLSTYCAILNKLLIWWSFDLKAIFDPPSWPPATAPVSLDSIFLNQLYYMVLNIFNYFIMINWYVNI